MPFDLDTLLGSDPSGLLTPQERGGVTGQSLMGMGAALLKAAAPSPYKHTTLSGLGEGVQGLLSSQRSATDELLKQHLVRAKTLEGALPLFKLMQDQAATGMPPDPAIAHLYRGIMPALGIGGGIGAGVPGAPGAAPGVVPGAGVPGVSPPGASAAAPGWKPPPQSPGALPPVDARQKFADENGFNRRALIPNAPGNAAFEKAFEEAHAGNPGYELQKEREEQTKQDVGDYGKKYTGINAMGQIAANVHQYATLAQDLLSSPGFYSGAGSDWVQAWNKLMVLSGRDPNTPMNPTARMEVFSKIMSEGLLGRIEELQALNKQYGESGGRSLLTVINTMAKANPNMDMTLPANKFLVDQIARESQRHKDISDAATDYAIAHPAGRLDKKWDKIHNQMLRKDMYAEGEHRGISSGAQLPGNAPSPILQGPPAPAPSPLNPAAGAPGSNFGGAAPSGVVGGPMLPDMFRAPAARPSGTVPFSDIPGSVPSATPFNARTRAAPQVAAGTKEDPIRVRSEAESHAIIPGKTDKYYITPDGRLHVIRGKG